MSRRHRERPGCPYGYQNYESCPFSMMNEVVLVLLTALLTGKGGPGEGSPKLVSELIERFAARLRPGTAPPESPRGEAGPEPEETK